MLNTSNKDFLEKFVEEILLQKEFNERLGALENFDYIFLKDLIYMNSNSLDFLKKTSSYFFLLLKKAVHVVVNNNKMSLILRNTVKNVFINCCNLKKEEEYVTNLLDFFAKKCIEFYEFLDRYDIENKSYLFTKYFLSRFQAFLLIPISKIKYLDLYEKFTKLYVLETYCKTNSEFFTNKLWKKRNSKEYFKFLLQKDPVTDTIREIENIQNPVKDNMFKRFAKLLKFCNKYKKKLPGLNEKKMLTYSLLRARKISDIISPCLDINISSLNGIRMYYSLSFIIISILDLIDVKDGFTNIFSISSKPGCLAYTKTLMGYLILYGQDIKYLYNILMILILDYNADILPDGIQEILIKSDFLDLKTYNFQKILDLLSDKGFIINCFHAYLTTLNTKNMSGNYIEKN